MEKQDRCSHHDFLLTKLDSNFEVIWHKQYGDPVNNDIAGKLLVESDGYTIGGYLNNSNRVTINYSYQSKIIKVDTSGNLLWTWLAPAGVKTGMIRDIVKTADGGYIHCSQSGGYEDPASSIFSIVYWRKSQVQKLSAARNVIWTDTFSTLADDGPFNEPRCLKQLSNGDIVVAGSVYGGYEPRDTVDMVYGSLIKLSPDGTVIWKRKYRHEQDTFLHHIYDLRQTPDGGFIMAGEAIDNLYPYNPPNQRGGLLKVDSNGCIGNDPQCWPVSVIQPGTIAYSVYPNPVNHTLSMRYPAETHEQYFELYSLTGNQILRQLLVPGSNHASVLIENLPSGMYLYSLSGKGQIYCRGKLQKL